MWDCACGVAQPAVIQLAAPPRNWGDCSGRCFCATTSPTRTSGGHTLLNRGESVHQLQRAIYYGRLAPERGRRRDELVAISGSHALLTNIVIAWNTAHMQTVVDRWRTEGMVVEDAWLRRLGPVHFEQINFRGTFSFGVQRYAQALIGQGPAVPQLARG